MDMQPIGGEQSEVEQSEKLEICLCVYPDGKLAITIDDGEEVPVESLDKALAGIKAFAEQEMGDQIKPGPTEPSAEDAMTAGFRGVRGGM